MTSTMAISLEKRDFFELDECPSFHPLFGTAKAISFGVLEGLTRFFGISYFQKIYEQVNGVPLPIVTLPKVAYAISGVAKGIAEGANRQKRSLCHERKSVSEKLRLEVNQLLFDKGIIVEGCDALYRRCYVDSISNGAPSSVEIKGSLAEEIDAYTSKVYNQS